MCQFPCERYCEVQLGIALLVHQRCHLDGLFDDELLVWSVTLQLQSDIISYLGDLRIWLIPFLGLRLEQMVIDARFECTGPNGLTTTEYEHQLTGMLKLIRSIDEANES